MTIHPDETLMSISPSEFTLRRWVELLTTPKDVWYWDDSLADIDITGQQLLDRLAFFAAYPDISYVNAYWRWRMPKSVQQVLVSDPAWIGSLEDGERQRVAAKQIELDRGLIFPETHFDTVPSALQPYHLDGKIVLSRAAWLSLDQADQFTSLHREMLLWDDAECFPIPDRIAPRVQAIANAYGDEHGTNCFSTTAFCVTGRDELHRRWMFQPEFLEVLGREGYKQVESNTAEPGDVITYVDNGTLVHAAYCVAPDRIINKNGQSMFNPVRVVNRAMLDADWAGTSAEVYRAEGN